VLDQATGLVPLGRLVDGDTVYLVYRLRWPRPRRGGELRIARGDGEHFETIWRSTREDFSSPRSNAARSFATAGRGGSTQLRGRL